ADALQLGALGQSFDTVLDSGLFHVFDEARAAAFVDSLQAVTVAGSRYFLLCFSDRQPGSVGPRRLTEHDIRTAFSRGWRIDSLERATMDITIDPRGAQAWLASMTRLRA
ncbi:MAG TPA: SAM-dependent methyltransferase, partial [Chloroflexota bacterium]